MPRPNRGEWRGAQDSRIRTDPATIANHAGRRPPSQIASKRHGRPKSFGLWYPAKNLGEQAEAAHARVTATSIFFSLASPLAVVSRSGSRSQPWPTCEYCAANLMKGLPKSAKHLLEINAEFPQARPSRSSLS